MTATHERTDCQLSEATTVTEHATTMTERREAVFDPEHVYRYRLTRTWNTGRAPLVFIGLNPSTADALKDDPTIRRARTFALRENAGGLVMVNLFAYRATDPRGLNFPEDPVGPGNDAFLRAAALEAGTVVAAWGARGDFDGRDTVVLGLLADLGVHVHCLGVTREGHPRHPLYLPAATPLEPYRPAPGRKTARIPADAAGHGGDR